VPGAARLPYFRQRNDPEFRGSYASAFAATFACSSLF
jgi:hypothetical protein